MLDLNRIKPRIRKWQVTSFRLTTNDVVRQVELLESSQVAQFLGDGACTSGGWRGTTTTGTNRYSPTGVKNTKVLHVYCACYIITLVSPGPTTTAFQTGVYK